MSDPSIFVGTMHCNEHGYDKCLASILCQTGVNVTHVVIRNRPEREAHNLLWREWRAVKDTGHYAMFVKVDADTELKEQTTLLSLWRLMSSDPDITGIQAPLHDMFTDGLINGLNCFAPSVIFNDSTDDLYCDRRVDVNHKRIVGSTEVPSELRPAGYHCRHANDVQAFHYGLHRALKGQVDTLDKVRAAYEKSGGFRRSLALAGAAAAHKFVETRAFNYADVQFNEEFLQAIKKKRVITC